jgi:hypothetical protein
MTEATTLEVITPCYMFIVILEGPQEQRWTAGGSCDHGVAFESAAELDIGVVQVADESNGGAAFESAEELELSVSIVMDSRRRLR